jgi:hypothetical protein
MKYYWTFLKTFMRNCKWLPGIISVFIYDAVRDTDKILKWQAIEESRSTGKPMKVNLSNCKLTVFPCGCEFEYYPKQKAYCICSVRCFEPEHIKKLGKIAPDLGDFILIHNIDKDFWK